jgi:CRP/FNR family transcriptional regulator
MPGLHDLDPLAELKLVPGFGDVAADAIQELAAITLQRRVHAQDLAAEQGQVSAGLLVLARGAVKVVRTVKTAGGDVARVLDVMRAATVIPDASAIDGLPAEASVVALRSSQIFVIERRALQRVMTTHPSVERALLARFARESRNQCRHTDELASGTVEERLLRLLDTLAAQHGTPLGQGKFIPLPLRRRDLASMVNATTETVSRLLAKLERAGRTRSTRDGIWWGIPPRRSPSEAVEPPAPPPPAPQLRDGNG